MDLAGCIAGQASFAPNICVVTIVHLYPRYGAAWRQPTLCAHAHQACSLGPSGDDRERGKRSGIF